MQAIEFEAIVQNHVIRIPGNIPNGAAIRVLLLVEEKLILQAENSDVKTLLATVTEGMTDADIERINDFGREQPEWDI